MDPRRARQIILVAGAGLGASFAAAAVLLIPATPVACVPYHLLPRELICGPDIRWVNPDGSIVTIGRAGDFAPMPKPPADRPGR